jgi:hypothetical protein
VTILKEGWYTFEAGDIIQLPERGLEELDKNAKYSCSDCIKHE